MEASMLYINSSCPTGIFNLVGIMQVKYDWDVILLLYSIFIFKFLSSLEHKNYSAYFVFISTLNTFDWRAF